MSLGLTVVGHLAGPMQPVMVRGVAVQDVTCPDPILPPFGDIAAAITPCEPRDDYAYSASFRKREAERPGVGWGVLSHVLGNLFHSGVRMLRSAPWLRLVEEDTWQRAQSRFAAHYYKAGSRKARPRYVPFRPARMRRIRREHDPRRQPSASLRVRQPPRRW